MLGLRHKGTSSSGRTGGQRLRITEEAAIWSRSSHSEWRAGSGLAPSPLVRLQANNYELQTTKYSIKQGNDEYQMCNCGSRWTQVENLQIWKAASDFYAPEAWLHIINVWLFNRGFNRGRGRTFGWGLKPKLTWFARSMVFYSWETARNNNMYNFATLQRPGCYGSWKQACFHHYWTELKSGGADGSVPDTIAYQFLLIRGGYRMISLILTTNNTVKQE